MKNGVVSENGVSQYHPSYPPPPKKRWKGLVIAVMGLVILSMLVPLVFLLGLHSGFHPGGSVSETQDTVPMSFSTPSVLEIDVQPHSRISRSQSEQEEQRPVDEPSKRVEPPPPKDNSYLKGVSVDKTDDGSSKQHHQTTKGSPGQDKKDATTRTNNVKIDRPNVVAPKKTVRDSNISCEIRYGSYCLWLSESKEDLKDPVLKKLKDVLYVARAYFPSIAKMPAHDTLSQELKQNIQVFEHMLSSAISDVDLPLPVDSQLQSMETALSQVKSLVTDSNNVDKKLRQLVDLSEDEASFHMKQGAYLYRLAVQTIPKSLHCLSMRLTVEYFRSGLPDSDSTAAQKFVDKTLYHFVIFSNNVLASSVVINSTVLHAKDSGKLVFHVLTDRQNYFAMKLWYSRSTFNRATVQVLNIEEEHESDMLTRLSPAEEFRVSFPGSKMPTEYLSVFSHSHYKLPKIFRKLEKVVVLDDDIVVQKDLLALWSIDMKGKVNGAVEHCAVKLGKLNRYLGGNVQNQKVCAWMSGLNVLDLRRWRELDVTQRFKSLVQELERNGQASEGGGSGSRASLLVFQDLVYPLDSSWVLSGLGNQYGISRERIKASPVLHYNGNMKPWVDLGIREYKTYWKKYVNRQDRMLSQCNVNP